MSTNKKQELLKNLSLRDKRKPPTDVTYEHKGNVLDQMIERPETPEQMPIEANNSITEELNNESKRGPKRKGEFKKVTLNLDVDLNRKLDAYINTLRGKAIEDGTEPPNKSEWVRDIVEEKLRELGGIQ